MLHKSNLTFFDVVIKIHGFIRAENFRMVDIEINA